MSRMFRVCEGRTVTLPQGLQAGPGATNVRLEEGAEFELQDAKCIEFGRFIAGRERQGDMIEIKPEDKRADAPPPKYVPSPDAPSSDSPDKRPALGEKPMQRKER